MTLCFVTDRLRLCGERTTFEAARRRLVEQVRAAIENGADLIQVRERDLDARALAVLVADLVALGRPARTRVVVNDRIDVAIACGADGVHLRGDSVSAAAARRIAPPRFLIGRSVHSVPEAIAAGPVDYLIAGTVFPTPSKPAGHGLLGPHGLRAIAEAVTVPVLAIGGMTLERLHALRDTGVAGAAGIRLFDSANGTP